MLIFSVYLSVCLMPLPEGRAITSGDKKIYKVCKKGKEKIRFKFEMKDDLNTFILDSRRSTSATVAICEIILYLTYATMQCVCKISNQKIIALGSNDF